MYEILHLILPVRPPRRLHTARTRILLASQNAQLRNLWPIIRSFATSCAFRASCVVWPHIIDAISSEATSHAKRCPALFMLHDFYRVSRVVLIYFGCSVHIRCAMRIAFGAKTWPANSGDQQMGLTHTLYLGGVQTQIGANRNEGRAGTVLIKSCARKMGARKMGPELSVSCRQTCIISEASSRLPVQRHST